MYAALLNQFRNYYFGKDCLLLFSIYCSNTSFVVIDKCRRFRQQILHQSLFKVGSFKIFTVKRKLFYFTNDPGLLSALKYFLMSCKIDQFKKSVGSKKCFCVRTKNCLYVVMGLLFQLGKTSLVPAFERWMLKGPGL